MGDGLGALVLGTAPLGPPRALIPVRTARHFAVPKKSIMKNQILFVQGGGEGVHEAWDIKLVDSLKRSLGPNYEVRYPRVSNEADPSYALWKAAHADEIAALDDGAIIIGHSIGGAILINALADEPPERRLAGVFLIAAPFLGAGGWPSDDIKGRTDLGAGLPSQTPISLYQGSRDETAPLAHVDLYQASDPGRDGAPAAWPRPPARQRLG